MLVPNQFPTVPSNRFRLALVGEAPGFDEANVGKPFVGASGRLLHGTINALGFSVKQCFVGNVCQIRPPGNDISRFAWEGPEIQGGLEKLRQDLITFRPNAICCIGDTALRAFWSGWEDIAKEKEEGGKKKTGAITKCRGSIYEADQILPGCKIVACLHPAYVLRNWKSQFFLRHDLKRARKEAETGEFEQPLRTGVLRPDVRDVEAVCKTYQEHPRLVSFDIEGYADNVGITMISMADKTHTGLVIPFFLDGQHYWTEEEELIIWKELAQLLENPCVPKLCQNGMYEIAVLALRHGIHVQGIVEDTMLKHWELFPEFEKNLGLQASLYTREPYYKQERTSDDTDAKLFYNLKDSLVTLECCQAQEKILERFPDSKRHYEFNVKLLQPLSYMAIQGCAFDKEAAEPIRKRAQAKHDVLQWWVSKEVGREINFKSSKDKLWLLYDHFKYKPYKRYGKTSAEIVLHKYRKLKGGNRVLDRLLQGIKLRTRVSDIDKLLMSEDGRLRANFNPVGTETGRLSSNQSNDVVSSFTKTGLLKWKHTGTNLQNVTKDLRVCFVPDDPETQWFFQADLEGADAWTVAADLAACGHPAMLNDLQAGIKPAKVLLLMLQYLDAGEDPEQVNSLGLEELKARTDALDVRSKKGYERYHCCKRVAHGTNYDSGVETTCETIFKDTDGEVVLSRYEGERYQRLYKKRYNPEPRKQYILRQLREHGCLQAACGIRRRFYGIRGGVIDGETARTALSFEPQANTTWATNMALLRCWEDPDNRNADGSLRVQPRLQVHDAMAGVFAKDDLDFFAAKIRVWFDNPMTLHGIDLTIPTDAEYGRNWKALDYSL